MYTIHSVTTISAYIINLERVRGCCGGGGGGGEGGDRHRKSERERGTDRQTEDRQTDRLTENLNSKTLFHKDCSSGSVNN